MFKEGLLASAAPSINASREGRGKLILYPLLVLRGDMVSALLRLRVIGAKTPRSCPEPFPYKPNQRKTGGKQCSPHRSSNNKRGRQLTGLAIVLSWDAAALEVLPRSLINYPID